MRHLKALSQECITGVVLPMAQASGVEGRLSVILDGARRRGETGLKMRLILSWVIIMPVYMFYLVAFSVALPPNRTVVMDVQSYRVISQANAATASLRSLRAHIHSTTTYPDPKDDDTMEGTLVLQRPNLARVDDPDAPFTFVSNGKESRLAGHDGGKAYSFTLPVNWNGDNMTADDESQPFVQYFFRPDFHRLGAYPVEGLKTGGFPADFRSYPLPVVGRYLGVQTWQGGQYQVVEFTRNNVPQLYSFKNITTVYVGTDHLVHRIVGKGYFTSGVRTDDISLTDLQSNKPLPHAAFRLSAQGQ